jgi:TonB-linked SusC/RagA family outer membrane protein
MNLNSKAVPVAWPDLSKLLLIMRLTAILLVVLLVQVSAKSFSQQVTLHEKNTSVENVLRLIEKQTNYQFFFKDGDLSTEKITINVNKVPLTKALDECFNNTAILYKIINHTIVLNSSTVIARPVTAAKIEGTVTDDKGEVLPGVTVTVKGTQVRASTDLNGKYSITTADPANTILVFTYIGYETQEISAADKTQIDVKLLSVNTALSEVIVTALNIKREEKSIGYAQQSVNVDQMTEARSQNITDMLAGKVSGIQVTTSGQPTGSVRVLLRGTGSITGNNQPLWVVDGVPIDNSMGGPDVTDFASLQSAVPAAQTLDYGNGAADLNPDDIESIVVLKGANAAALYGSKAANGAILVTTKKGNKNVKGLGVSVNFNYQQSRVYEYLDVQDIYGEGNAFSRGGVNNLNPKTRRLTEGTNNRSWGPPMLGQPWEDYSARPIGYLPQPNNIRDLYQSPFTATQNVSLSQADQTYSFRLSYTHTDGNDVIEKQNLRNKHNFAINASKQIKNLKLDARIQYVNDQVVNRTPTGLNTQSPMSAYVFMSRSLTLPSLVPWKDPNGNAFNYGYSSFENPYWSINENYNKNRNNRIIGGVTATVSITKELQVRIQTAADLAYNNGFAFFQKGGLLNKQGYYSNYTQNNQNWNTEALIMYNKRVSKFTFSGNLGGNIATQNNFGTSAVANTLAVRDKMSLANALGVPLSTENYLQAQTNSVYGLLSVGYNDYLFVDVTGRNDWSSTLPAANRSFFYPSLSGSFIFSEFFKLPSHILSYGKLRASITRVGNATSPYNLISAFNYAGNINGNPYLAFDTRLKTEDLKPEQKTSTELGLEMRFLKGRLSLDATVYKSSNKNQIFYAQSAPEIGFQSTVINAGEVQNKGIEITINGTPIQVRNFNWNVTANFAKNVNKVISLAPGIDRFVMGTYSSGFSINAEVGQPLGTLRGNVPYLDAKGNVIVRANGQPYPDLDARAGNFQPKFLGSLGNTFRYKNFDLSFLVNVKIGGDIYSVTALRQQVAGNSIATLNGRESDFFSSQILGETGTELQGVTTIGNLPYPDAVRAKGLTFGGNYAALDGAGNPVLDANGRMVAGAKNTTWVSAQGYYQYDNAHYFLYDGTFVKLNQAIIGYNIPRKILGKLSIQAARISLVGRNIWTIYKRTPKGIDPESAATSGNNQGIELGGSLPYSSYGVDLKVSF